MTLIQKVFDENLTISLTTLSGDSELTKDIQERLAKIGFVDLASVSLGSLSCAQF